MAWAASAGVGQLGARAEREDQAGLGVAGHGHRAAAIALARQQAGLLQRLLRRGARATAGCSWARGRPASAAWASDAQASAGDAAPRPPRRRSSRKPPTRPAAGQQQPPVRAAQVRAVEVAVDASGQ